MNHDLEFKSLSIKPDFTAVKALFETCNDYVRFEQGKPVDDAYVTQYFRGQPPGQGMVFKKSIGVFEAGNLVGLIDVITSYPKLSDWYLGLLLFTPKARERGLGPQALNWIIDAARGKSTQRLLLCVLEGNTAGRRFWAREGFVYLRETDVVKIGKAKHIRHELVRTL